MEIYKVSNDADSALRKKISDLLFLKMENIGSDDPLERIEHALDLTLQEGSSAHIFVAEEDNRIVGIAFFNIGISVKKGGKYVWLNDLYVHPDYRNRGIAKKILLKLIHWAEGEGCKGIELETGINNAATKALYNSLGFYEIVSKRYGYRY